MTEAQTTRLKVYTPSSLPDPAGRENELIELQLANNDRILMHSDGATWRQFGRDISGPALRGGYSVFSGNADAGTAGTIQVMWQAPAPFTGVRLCYTNYTAGALTMAKARVATTAVKGVNGAALTWANALFNAGASANLPAAVNTAPNEEFTQVVSDLVQISPADSQNLLYTRSDYAAAFGCTDPGAGAMAQWNNNNPYGATFQVGVSAGIVANDTVGITMAANGRSVAPDSIVFYYSVPTVFVSACGGSHLRGDTTYGDAMGFIYRACMMRNQQAGGTKVWSLSNQSRSGGGSAPALANIKLLDAAGVMPHVIVMLASSGDDGSATATRMAAAQMRLAECLEICRRNRTRPIICTSPPVGSYTTGPGSEDALRKAQNQWARNLRYHGVDILDLEAIYTDPGDPLRHTINPLWTVGGIHVNDTGQLIAASALAAML